MIPTQRRRERRCLRRAAILAAWGTTGVALAQASSLPPSTPPGGFQLGPAVFAPSLTAGYSYDSNVFLKSESAAPPADDLLTVEPSVLVTIPFSNSTFRVGDTLRWVDYKKTEQTAGQTSNEALADLALRFGSLDTLELMAKLVSGVAETLAFDPGGEVVFSGKAFRAQNQRVSLLRDVEGARGYRVLVEHNEVHFDRTNDAYFFDYDGYEFEASYLEPLSSNTHLGFGYLGTRYDHFDVGPGADPDAVFRTETGDTAYVSLDGRLGTHQPYRVKVGWEQLRFAGNDAKDYSGPIVDTDVTFLAGRATAVALTLQHRPLRSFFSDNNFYVYDQVGARAERGLTYGTKVGGSVGYSWSDYREPVPPGEFAAGLLRRDRAMTFQLYATLAIRDFVGFRITVGENRKTSNYPGADYNQTVVSGGFVFGWY